MDVKHNKEDGEKRFNQLSIEERTKIDECGWYQEAKHHKQESWLRQRVHSGKNLAEQLHFIIIHVKQKRDEE